MLGADLMAGDEDPRAHAPKLLGRALARISTQAVLACPSGPMWPEYCRSAEPIRADLDARKVSPRQQTLPVSLDAPRMGAKSTPLWGRCSRRESG